MGTGGMRYGAGRPGWHVKAEHCKQLDVRRWQRLEVLQAGASGTWVWSNAETGARTGAIGYRSEGGAVDQRDARQSMLGQAIEHVGHVIVGEHLAFAIRGELVQVVPRAEDAFTGATQQERSNASWHPQSLAQLLEHRLVERVALGRVRQREHPHARRQVADLEAGRHA